MAAEGNIPIYAPLDKKQEEIRVIELAPGNPADAVTASILTVSLLDKTSFEALSYVWGDFNDTVPITLDLHAVPVTVNLEAALRRVRLSHVPRKIWADAVCINQADFIERNSQVLLMRKVYAQCKKVLIWLGEETETDKVAFDFVNSWMRATRPNPRDGGAYRLLHHVASMKNARHLNIHGCFQQRDGEWVDHQLELSALRRLLEKPWWSRAWTLQEIALARNVDLFCGSLCLDWKPFVDFSDAMEMHLSIINCCGSRFDRYCPDCRDALRFCKRRIDVVEETKNAVQRPQSMQTLTLLERHRFRNATDPRDHIYAYIGLAQGTRWDKVAPSYMASVELVYINYAIIEIRKSRTLKTLTHVANNGPSSLQLPSWVPDWSSRYVLQAGKDEWSTSSVERYGSYCACEEYGNPIPVFYRNCVLSQEGMELGSILHLGEVYTKAVRGINWAVLRNWRDLAQLDCNWLEIYQHGTDTNENAFWHCVLADAMVEGATFTFTRTKSGDRAVLQKWLKLMEERVKATTSATEHKVRHTKLPEWIRRIRCSKSTRKVQRGIDWMEQKAIIHKIASDFLWQWWFWTFIQSVQGKISNLLMNKQPDEDKPWSDSELEMTIAMEEASLGRRFFIADTGYIGTGPSKLQEGDQIWILKGGRWPLALKRDRIELLSTRRVHMEVGTHKNVGECYVHGVMDRETVDHFEDQKQIVYIT